MAEAESDKKAEPPYVNAVQPEMLGLLAEGDVRQRLFAEGTNLFGVDKIGKKLELLGTDAAIAAAVNTDIGDGLKSSQVEANRGTFGANVFAEAAPKSYCSLVCEQMEDLALRVLSVAAAVSIGIGIYEESVHPSTFPAYIDGLAILVAVVLVSNVGALNDWQKDRQFRKLNAQKNNFEVKVWRDSKLFEVKVDQIVVGDIIQLSQGDKIPGDGIFVHLESSEIKIDEASMTGESDMIRKVCDRNNPDCAQIMLMGTYVSEGAGKMMVLAVGGDTIYGKTMMSMAQGGAENTPLQEKLENMVTLIGKVGTACAFAVIIAFNAVCFSGTLDQASCGNSPAQIVIKAFIAGIVIVVVAIPEGLPLAVTIALAYSSTVMVKEQVLVRTLDACETMGGATNICSDKTGTLTTNKMTVTSGWIAGDDYPQLPKFSDTIKDENGNITGGVGGTNPLCKERKFNDQVLDLLNEALCLNAAASVKYEFDSTGLRYMPVGTGSASEIAMLGLMHQYGYEYLRANPDINEYDWPADVNFETYALLMRRTLEKQAEEDADGVQCVKYPFNSGKKRSSIVFKKKSGKYRVHTKGASERVLALCNQYIDNAGNNVAIDDQVRSSLMAKVDDMASSGLRTFTVAYGDYDSLNAWDDENPSVDTTPLICIAILGIKDPVRDEVPGAVATCHGAGICVRMVTGDKLETAKHIATECNIFKPDQGDVAMEGADFRKHFTRIEYPNQEERRKKGENLYYFKYDADVVYPMVEKVKVLARSSPEDKEMMVSALKDMDNVVGATGDGTNDAPALKSANVGLAMGITGTEIAKEAADIILLDDAFDSIVTAVKWGRNIFLNIRKFLQFQLTVNVVALVVAFIAACFGKMPLTPIQLLWVNLIMDTFAALALATEPPNAEELLSTPPYNKEALVTPIMWRNIFVQSAYQLVMIFTLFFGPEMYGIPTLTNNTAEECALNTNMDKPCDLSSATVQDCMIFHSFVLMQCFNELNARQIGNGFNIFDRIWLSKMFIVVWVGTFGVQFVLVEALGRVGPIFKTVPLTGTQHLICILFGAGSIPVGLLMRFLPSVPVPGAGGNNNAVGPARSESDRQLTTADGKVKETGEV